jgi:hypothetical protein
MNGDYSMSHNLIRSVAVYSFPKGQIVGEKGGFAYARNLCVFGPSS